MIIRPYNPLYDNNLQFVLGQNISAAIPNARPSDTINTFRGEPPDPLARTHSRAANPASEPSIADGIRVPYPATELSALPGCIRECTEQEKGFTF